MPKTMETRLRRIRRQASAHGADARWEVDALGGLFRRWEFVDQFAAN